jgi:hypothetical protein
MAKGLELTYRGDLIHDVDEIHGRSGEQMQRHGVQKESRHVLFSVMFCNPDDLKIRLARREGPSVASQGDD